MLRVEGNMLRVNAFIRNHHNLQVNALWAGKHLVGIAGRVCVFRYGKKIYLQKKQLV